MKNLKYAFVSALLLSSCTMTGKSHTANTLGNTLSGHIIDWPADLKGEVHLTGWWVDATFATASIDAQGNFKLVLPDAKNDPASQTKVAELFAAKSVYEQYGSACKAQGQAVPNTGTFQQGYVEVWVDGKRYGDLNLNNTVSMIEKPGDAEAAIFYFSEPTTLTGRIDCEPDENDYAFKGQYPAGWSLVRHVMSLTPSGASLYSYDPAAPLTGLEWRLFQEYGGVGLTLDQKTQAIKTIVPGQPAEKAGLKVGDVIVSLDGKPLAQSGGFRGEPNTKLVLVIKRDGQEMTFEITRALLRAP